MMQHCIHTAVSLLSLLPGHTLEVPKGCPWTVNELLQGSSPHCSSSTSHGILLNAAAADNLHLALGSADLTDVCRTLNNLGRMQGVTC